MLMVNVDIIKAKYSLVGIDLANHDRPIALSLTQFNMGDVMKIRTETGLVVRRFSELGL